MKKTISTIVGPSIGSNSSIEINMAINRRNRNTELDNYDATIAGVGQEIPETGVTKATVPSFGSFLQA